MDSNEFEQHLEKYAELVVRVGVNIQPGQVLLVESPLEAAGFTRKVVQKSVSSGSQICSGAVGRRGSDENPFRLCAGRVVFLLPGVDCANDGTARRRRGSAAEHQSARPRIIQGR